MFGDHRLPSRFWAKVHPEPTTGCWLWLGATTSHGYGHIKIDGRMRPAHLLAYEALVGPIADGMHGDHLCRTRSCCNPRDIQPVTPGENTRRGIAPILLSWFNAERAAAITHCPRGHEYAGRNLIIRPSGRRGCRVCTYVRAEAFRQRRSLGGSQ